MFAWKARSAASGSGRSAGGFFSTLAGVFERTAGAAVGMGAGVEVSSRNLTALSKAGGIAAGIALVAGAIGDIALQAAKSNESIDKIKGRLEGLAGTKVGGELADGLQKMARDAGALPAQLEPAVEALTKLQQKLVGEDVGGGFATLDGLDRVEYDVFPVGPKASTGEKLRAAWRVLRERPEE